MRLLAAAAFLPVPMFATVEPSFSRMGKAASGVIGMGLGSLLPGRPPCQWSVRVFLVFRLPSETLRPQSVGNDRRAEPLEFLGRDADPLARERPRRRGGHCLPGLLVDLTAGEQSVSAWNASTAERVKPPKMPSLLPTG